MPKRRSRECVDRMQRQVTEDLSVLLEESPPGFEFTLVLAMLTSAKALQIQREQTRQKQELSKELENLFSRQSKKFMDAGFPKAMGISNGDFMSLVNPLYFRIPALVKQDIFNFIETGSIHFDFPLLLVIPHSLLPIEEQIKLLKINGRGGNIHVPKDSYEKCVSLEEKPYMVFGIETVLKLYDYPNENFILRSKGRVGLNIEEGIAFSIFRPNILEKFRNLRLLGAETEDFVHFLWLWNEKPGLSRFIKTKEGNPLYPAPSRFIKKITQ